MTQQNRKKMNAGIRVTLSSHHTRVSSSCLRDFDFGLLQDSSQIGLLKELLDLQKDMVVMLLSLLEGIATYCSVVLLF